MIRKIAWDTFKNTGDINAFLELKQIENIENQMNSKEERSNQIKLENDFDSKNQKVDETKWQM
ncbi:MAG: hypothetical protein HFJ37_01745 [Clostridia bacterium]|nr:hypothetical protein [Clostridia bacterium]